MQLDCPANVVTLADGEVACQDGTGAAVAWLVTPAFEVSSLEPSQLFSSFAAGFVLVATFWSFGKGIALILQQVRR